MGVILAIFCIVAPYARLQLLPITGFIPVYGTVIAINNVITAALIFAQFWVVRWTWLLILAGGYFFAGLIIVPYVLTFPEAFAPSGLLGAGTQTSAWVAAAWHLGSPMILIVAMLVRGSRETTGTWQPAPGVTIVLSIFLVNAIVWGLTWAIVAYDQMLPQVYMGQIQLRHVIIALAIPFITLDVVALGLLWLRRRSVLDLWLMVMCVTWLSEVLLSGILAGSRFSVGWYSGRIFEMTATFVVLLLFLSEKTALYANLARSTIQQRGARHARQIAMDAMAASIGHEIRQPLAAVVINADVCTRQLGKAEPDVEEALATVKDIAADARRISDIIGSVRTMFRGSTHDRQLLNLNGIIRDVLATVELDLRLQRVTVKRDMNDNLPQIPADSGQLHQVFLNLITNALEAMSGVTDRTPVLRITSSTMAGSSDVAVTVEDTGVGIAGKNSDQIFEPFYSTKAAGTGIGLSICKVIIEAHGGSLTVSANRPYGTTFRVILPVSGEE